MNWISIIISTIISLIIPAACFFCKRFVIFCFNRWNRQYQHELDLTLESHKTELNQILDKVRIEYGNIYTKRLTAIETIYRKLIVIRYTIRQYRTGEYINEETDLYSSGEAYLTHLVKCIRNFRRPVYLSLIYFSETDAESLLQLTNNLYKFVEQYEKESPQGGP